MKNNNQSVKDINIPTVENYFDTPDESNPFLSPIESERNKQEEDLKLLFPEYPNIQNWQMLNSLIHIAKKVLSSVPIQGNNL